MQKILKPFYTIEDAKAALTQHSLNTSIKHVIFACDKNDQHAKIFHVVPFDKYKRLLLKNRNMYEVFTQTEVRGYLDIDDTTSTSQEQSETYIKDLIKDFKIMFGFFEPHVLITSHGVSKGKMKYSYTIIFPQFKFESIKHHKQAVINFLDEFPTYRDVLDTAVYKPTQMFRAVNQSKRGDPRVNALKTQHDIEETIISCITPETQMTFVDLPEEVRLRKSCRQPVQRGMVLGKSNPVVRKIVLKLPKPFYTDYQAWRQVLLFIKAHGGYNDFVDFSKQSSKYDRFKDEKKFENEDGFAYTLEGFFGFLANKPPEMYNGQANKSKVLDYIKPRLVDLYPQYTPFPEEENHVMTNNRYIQLTGEMLKSHCTMIEASQGCGKTTAAVNMYTKKYSRHMLLCLVSRQSLASTMVTAFRKKNVRIHNYLDLKKKEYNNGNVRHLAIQVDSIVHLRKKFWKNSILVIDEISSLLKYIAFSTTLENRRRRVMNALCFLLQNSRKIILLDADLSPMVVNLCSMLKIKNKVFRNTHQPLNGKEVEITCSYNEFENSIKTVDKKNGLWIVSDTKQGLEDLVERLGFQDVVFFTSTDYDKDVIENINKTCKNRIVAVTPKVLYGVSFESDVPVPVYGFFNKTHLSPSQKLQQIRRVRNPGKIVLYDTRRSKSLRKYTSPEDVQNSLVRETECGIYKHSDFDLIGGEDNTFVEKVFSKLFCDALYDDDWQRADPFRTLKTLLNRAGFRVVESNKRKSAKPKPDVGKNKKTMEAHTALDNILRRILKDEKPFFREKNDKTLFEAFKWRLRADGEACNLEDELKETQNTINKIWKSRHNYYENHAFEKHMFRKLMQKKDIEFDLFLQREHDFDKPLLRSLLAKVNVAKKMSKELGLKSWLSLPSLDKVKALAHTSSNLVTVTKIGNSLVSKEAEHIDKLFRYRRSIKAAAKPFGWALVYSKYISILRSHAGIKMDVDKRISVKGKRLIVFKLNV